MADQRQTRFCGECGEAISSVAKYCSSCGTKLSQFDVERPNVDDPPSSNPAPSETTPNNADAAAQEDLKQALPEVSSPPQAQPDQPPALTRTELDQLRIQGEERKRHSGTTTRRQPVQRSESSAQRRSRHNPDEISRRHLDELPAKSIEEVRADLPKGSANEPALADTQRQHPAASRWSRLFAHCLSWIYVVVAYMFMSLLLITAIPVMEDDSALYVAFSACLLAVHVWELIPFANGAGGLGKRTLGLRIMGWSKDSHSPHPPQLSQLLGRFVVKLFLLAIPIVNFIFIFALVIDKNKRSAWDKASGTVVIKAR